tara:strand:+ start:8709 stop:9656 length:948 start_codon:yes stop_codon:yes gene_type:complete
MEDANVGTVEAPVADAVANDSSSLADLVDVSPQAETEPVQAAETQAAEPQEVETPVFNALDAELGHIEELKHDGFYKDIDERHIKDLPTTARRILHNFRVDKKLQEQKHRTAMQEMQAGVEERESRLANMEREFARRQAEFAAVAEDPKLKEILDKSEDQLPDIFTEEGIDARIQRGIAQGIRNILEPMQQSARAKASEAAYLDFLEKHPEMKQADFKSEVARMVRTRKEVGDPIKTQDAYQLVKARRILHEKQARAQRETAARAQAARRVGTNTVGGKPGSDSIPKDVMKRGANAIAQWLQSNPEAAKKIRSTL